MIGRWAEIVNGKFLGGGLVDQMLMGGVSKGYTEDVC
jgi:hypothetical protein